MDEVEFTNDAEVQEHFGGIEPVNVGDLSDVQEQKLLIPATKNVKLLIKVADMRTPKDHNDYRWINLQLQLVDGIDESGKYKGKVVVVHGFDRFKSGAVRHPSFGGFRDDKDPKDCVFPDQKKYKG